MEEGKSNYREYEKQSIVYVFRCKYLIEELKEIAAFKDIVYLPAALPSRRNKDVDCTYTREQAGRQYKPRRFYH